MIKILKSTNSDFADCFASLLNRKFDTNKEIHSVVSGIIERVAKYGDDALIEYTNKFDHMEITESQIRISDKEIDEAYNLCSNVAINSLTVAAERIESYHKKQLPIDFEYIDDTGTTLGNIWKSLKSVGIYVPGGLANYPSSVLMNAIPAKVAGVTDINMVVPTPHGKINPLVLAAAKIIGIKNVYRVGGAQAVAALAYGTKTIAPVDKIVGPGNAYVAAAKQLVFGKVGIDMIAGPSEITIVADKNNNPEWVAADLLSQAEHDSLAQSILITDDVEFAEQVSASIEKLLSGLARKEIAERSIRDNGAIIIVNDLYEKAQNLVNKIAPEHLEILLENPEILAEKIYNAGAIFLGKYTPEAIGDYIAGPSHVLPTSGTARFSSGLSVFDFLKRVSLIKCSEESFAHIANHAAILAKNEGLGAHALSVECRIKKL